VVRGEGIIRSWTVVRDAFLSGFSDELPYLLVDVELDVEPGLRMIGRLVNGVEARLRFGDRVVVTFDVIGEGIAVPSFRLGSR